MPPSGRTHPMIPNARHRRGNTAASACPATSAPGRTSSPAGWARSDNAPRHLPAAHCARRNPLTTAPPTLHGTQPQPDEDAKMRQTAPADAATSQPVADDLPAWDLSDLYPGPDSPALQADFVKAEQAAKAFSAAYQGKLANM